MTLRTGVPILLLTLSACDLRDAPRPATAGGAPPAAQQGEGVVVERPASIRPTPPLPARFATVGRRARRDEVQAWDIDVNPTGASLPRGRGTYDAGAKLYVAQCAACHGAKGEGVPPFPRLIGAEPRDFSFARDFRLHRTIGNYWPYATTLYDYINRAMPFTAPGSLEPDEVYSLVAYLLAENQVIERTAVMDRESLPRVRMPARDRFVPDNRAGGATFK